jgi:intracellular septation protein
MKILFDFLPIVLFFVAYKLADANKDAAAALATTHFGFLVSGGVVGASEAAVLLATVVVIVATLAQVAVLAALRKKIDMMLWVSLALVVVMGGLTVWLHNATFIKWKPTLLYWVMGAVFALAPLLFGKNLLKVLLGEQLVLPEPVWQRLNLAWVVFFSVMGALNIWVAFNFAESTWVNFKLFGSLGLMLVFTIAQGVYLSRYLPDEGEAPKKDAP